MTYWALLKNSTFNGKATLDDFWATIGKIRLLFIRTREHLIRGKLKTGMESKDVCLIPTGRVYLQISDPFLFLKWIRTWIFRVERKQADHQSNTVVYKLYLYGTFVNKILPS